MIGADTHKQSHTVAAVDAATDRVITDNRQGPSAARLMPCWSGPTTFDGELVWAIKDCRRDFETLERFLLKRGEQITRVGPRLIVGARRSVRERGKSDCIDAVQIAQGSAARGPRHAPDCAAGGDRTSTWGCS